MKKTLISLVVGVVLAASSNNLYAENLAEVYQLALKSDPTLLKAQALAIAAKEGIIQARAILLPQLNASADMSSRESETQNYQTAFQELAPIGSLITLTTDSTTYGAELTMQLYHHDSWLKMSNAKKSAHQSDLNFQLAKQQLIIRVTKAYFDILDAKESLKFAVAEKTAIARQLEQTKQRFAVGLTAITDVHEAQAQYDNAITSEIKAEHKVFSTEEELRTITDVYPTNLSALNTSSFSTTTPAPKSANEWQQIAESKSLDIIVQKVSVDIAKKNIDIAQAGHYPTIDFKGSAGKSTSTTGFAAQNGNITFPSTPYYNSQNLGITLTVPLYSGGATSSIVRQAQQNYVVASQDLALAHRSVVRDTRNAYHTVIEAISSIKALQQSVISAESALKATQAGFEVGTRTIVDVLNSTRNLYDAKRNLATTRYGYIQSVLALKRASGLISFQDIIDINNGLSAG